jgi:hypothetical protein
MRRPRISSRLLANYIVLNNDSHQFTCEVMRQETEEDRGIQVSVDSEDAWPVIDTDVPVNVYPSQVPRYGQEGAAVIVEGGYDAAFDAGYDIRNKDRIRVTSGPSTGRVFRMIGPRFGTLEAARIMACEEE